MLSIIQEYDLGNEIQNYQEILSQLINEKTA